jgi:hypothetical protein
MSPSLTLHEQRDLIRQTIIDLKAQRNPRAAKEELCNAVSDLIEIEKRIRLLNGGNTPLANPIGHGSNG